MKKKLLSILFSAISLFSLTSCASSPIKLNPNKAKYVVGVTQLVRHVALDAATQGFKDQIKVELESRNRKVSFVETNAQGENSLCNVNATALLSRNVDLILATATPPFQAVVNATRNVPILGTAITSYDSALNQTFEDNLIGGNISGTSDLAPLDEQAKMLFDLKDGVKDIGLLYCTSEPNSIYQIKMIKKEIEKIAKSRNTPVNVKDYGFVDSNEVEQIARLASSKSDIIYCPTDNVIANTKNTIYAATAHGKDGKRTPIICGEEGVLDIAIATITISYYELGKLTGEMGAKILTGEMDISKTPIAFSNNVTKKKNTKVIKECGLELDERFDGYLDI